MADSRDINLEDIQNLKLRVAEGTQYLRGMHSNQENFALNCNKKMTIDNILTNNELLQNYITQIPDYEAKIKAKLKELEGLLQQNIINFHYFMERFQPIIISNINDVTMLQSQIISQQLKPWKHEQQKMANGTIKKEPFILKLDKLQLLCEELAEVIWKIFEQLNEAKRILERGLIVPTENCSYLPFVEARITEIQNLLQNLLNNSLIVETQPPQIIKTNNKFPIVQVSLLIGCKLNVHMNNPELFAKLINEKQAKSLGTSDKIETIGKITNGRALMDKSNDFKRTTFLFKAMQIEKRAFNKGNTNNKLVTEEKTCIYFECQVTVGPLNFKVHTISFPMIITSHCSQDARATIGILWDNAFSQLGREPFEVPEEGSWSEVAKMLNAKFIEVTERALTDDYLVCLAKKIFGLTGNQPIPETVTWSQLCKTNLPGRNFTFWTWFFAALRLIEKKETELKQVWKDGLINGFIEKETAEYLISQCPVGTFLVRFSDSYMGALTITFAEAGGVKSTLPFQLLDLQSKKLWISIMELDQLKYLYQPNPYSGYDLVPKHQVFKKFCEQKKNTHVPAIPAGYVAVVSTIKNANNFDESPNPSTSSYQPGGNNYSRPVLTDEFSTSNLNYLSSFSTDSIPALNSSNENGNGINSQVPVFDTDADMFQLSPDECELFANTLENLDMDIMEQKC